MERTPTSAQLLDAWEAGSAARPARRPIALLTAAYPDQPPEDLARLSIGERDARLLALRNQLFGPELACTGACPRCAERLELSFQVADILIPAPAVPKATPLTITVGRYEVTVRLPDSTDLEALVPGSGADLAGILLGRCLLDARRDGRRCPHARLPQSVVLAVARQMAHADPQGDVELALTCPGCHHEWLAPFDIAAFLWLEVDAWARRLLDEVACLARAFGWREADVLALGPRRRGYYLDRAGR